MQTIFDDEYFCHRRFLHRFVGGYLPTKKCTLSEKHCIPGSFFSGCPTENSSFSEVAIYSLGSGNLAFIRVSCAGAWIHRYCLSWWPYFTYICTSNHPSINQALAVRSVVATWSCSLLTRLMEGPYLQEGYREGRGLSHKINNPSSQLRLSACAISNKLYTMSILVQN